jgi:hypothetical protein
MTDNKIASRDRQVQTVQERHANVGLPVTLEPGPVDLSTISGCNALAMWPHLQDRTPPMRYPVSPPPGAATYRASGLVP